MAGSWGRARLQIWTIFESHFSHLKTARCCLAACWQGGRGGMLRERERSVSNPEISIQNSEDQNNICCSNIFLYFRWDTDKVQWRNRERERESKDLSKYSHGAINQLRSNPCHCTDGALTPGHAGHHQPIRGQGWGHWPIRGLSEARQTISSFWLSVTADQL